MIEFRRNQTVDNNEYNQLRPRAWGRQTGLDWRRCWLEASAGSPPMLLAAWDGGGHMFRLDTTVDPDYQRHGIGTELVQRAIGLSADAGGDWLHVDSDEVSMRLLQALGASSRRRAGLVNLHTVRGARPPKEERIDGGARWPISREGDVVYKAAGQWTPAVPALLRQPGGGGLHWRAAARRSGIAPDGRQMLTFIEGGGPSARVE